MSENKKIRAEKIIRDLAANFLTMESNRKSLITVTRVEIRGGGKTANIFFTVLPENQEKAAIDFAKRKRSDFREFVKSNSRLMIIPFFDFEIDKGEKARQKIDGLSSDL